MYRISITFFGEILVKLFVFFRTNLSFDILFFFPAMPITLLRSGSEWPFDQASLLTHSRDARKFYDPKIKRIFEIARANFEKILFIHFYPNK